MVLRGGDVTDEHQKHELTADDDVTKVSLQRNSCRSTFACCSMFVTSSALSVGDEVKNIQQQAKS